jgi:predicted metal-dependent hydrolase
MFSLLEIFQKTAADKALDSLTLDVAGSVIIVALKRNARARRMTLRMDRKPNAAVMTLPRRVSREEALAFAERSSAWIAKQLLRQSPGMEISHGAQVPLRGTNHTIIATGKLRGVVARDESTLTLHVPGASAHLRRRLTDWMKAEAKLDLTRACEHYARVMAVRYTSLSVRDQKSRWGSCAASGALSFSWRLIMAPDFVLDYVAAHEIAHLREMNHGPKFWRLVLSHCNNTRAAKAWLKTHGRDLHLVG